MDYTQVLILSTVEGVTEFLPISSTGHLILTSELLKIPQTEFIKTFEIFIQLGAILSVIFLYWKTILKNKKLYKNILAAFLPTALIGLTFYQLIKDVLLESPFLVVITLLIGGFLLIGFEIWFKDKERPIGSIENLNLKQAFLIGICQSISIIPGTSRSAASIIGGLAIGLERKAAVEFSFLLAVPTMFAAAGLDLIKINFSFSASEWMMLMVGFVGSFIVALAVVKWFLKFIQNNNFIGFGIYRVILGLLYWFFIINS